MATSPNIYGLKTKGRHGDVLTVLWEVNIDCWAWLRRPGEPRRYEPGAPLLGGTLTLSALGRSGALKLAQELRKVADEIQRGACNIGELRLPDGADL
jgi:hypothetical protein